MNGTFVFVLILVAIVMSARIVQSWLAHRQTRGGTDEEVEDTLAKIEALEERVRVLERIITENRYDLKKEIDSL